ncbi:hypothetical protein ISN45_At05g051320 [Arabidopsis thaliana x Arabidopsis arenosa]|uniref:Uncharacterized protein n=1 Tax=Arabidopsis thaliana x Arabidopsis arenosa TaxID=1240361 RepID=A0A8T2D2S0_9BRAS|nr:hypothetical protein ISN45_At05g051320 [Arabidopsis thaliana x Arabidopsis arenosa]
MTQGKRKHPCDLKNPSKRAPPATCNKPNGAILCGDFCLHEGYNIGKCVMRRTGKACICSQCEGC